MFLKLQILQIFTDIACNVDVMEVINIIPGTAELNAQCAQFCTYFLNLSKLDRGFMHPLFEAQSDLRAKFLTGSAAPAQYMMLLYRASHPYLKFKKISISASFLLKTIF